MCILPSPEMHGRSRQWRERGSHFHAGLTRNPPFFRLSTAMLCFPTILSSPLPPGLHINVVYLIPTPSLSSLPRLPGWSHCFLTPSPHPRHAWCVLSLFLPLAVRQSLIKDEDPLEIPGNHLWGCLLPPLPLHNPFLRSFIR